MKHIHRNQFGVSRGVTLIGLAVALIILLVVGYFVTERQRVGVGQEYSPSDGPAIVNNSTGLYSSLGDGARFESFREDLAVFGRTSIKSYQQGKVADVIFEVGDEIKDNENVLVFDGKFKESGDTISVTVKKLNNGRVYTTLKNTKTGFSMDASLPSNTARNQYIGTLPKDAEGYSIAYLSSTDSFFVTITGADMTALQRAARDEIKQQVGEDEFKEEDVSYVAWGANGVPSSLSAPDEPRYEVTEEDF
jgi:hypothetical protein